MRCALCRETMDYLHGHAACVNSVCPMFGLNQAPCCDGETAEHCELTRLDASSARNLRPSAGVSGGFR